MLKIRFLVKIIENLTQTTWFFLDYLRIRRWKEFGIELAPDNHVPRRILSRFPHRNRFPSGAPPFDHGSAHRLLLCAAPSAAARSAKALKRHTEICPSAWGLGRVGGHSSGHCYPLCLGAQRGRKSGRVGDRGRRAATVMAEVRWNNDMRKKGIKVFAHLEFP